MARLLASAAAALCLAPAAGQSLEDKFGEFVAAFGKTYASVEERASKLEVFARNLEHIARFRSVEEGAANYSHLSPFADLSPEEFSQRHGFKASDRRPALQDSLDVFDTSALPEHFDWREKGAVNEIKDQKQCGSCWTFATVANIEGAIFLATKKLVSLSEQELVDCDEMNHGCHGGDQSQAMQNLIQKNLGLETEQAYPYTAKDGQCQASASKEVAFVGAYKRISTNEDQIAAALMQYGPLSISINAAPLQFYSGGISKPWRLFCNPSGLDHAVTLVGFGAEKGKYWGTNKYWVIRNSWGTSWGEQGYFRFGRGFGACGMNTDVSTVTDVELRPAAPSFVV